MLTKWTRNFGFCITYSALLLKTWRVSLTYRVKSAHKIKLTDKQLLQWLFPILLVMAIYLAAWTISDTPRPKYIVDWNELKFKQCDYNWWDHSLTIGKCNPQCNPQFPPLTLLSFRRVSLSSLGHQSLLQCSKCRITIQRSEIHYLGNLQYYPGQ